MLFELLVLNQVFDKFVIYHYGKKPIFTNFKINYA